MLTPGEGTFAVRLARSAISSWLSNGSLLAPKPAPSLAKKFSERLGVFVTLKCFPSNELRGCIGFPEPIAPLAQGIAEAAACAAFEDSRFPPVSESELQNLTIEVSVLTTPEEIAGKPEDRIKQIRVGRDGLIIRSGNCSGLLLPQVAPEQKWNAGEFLAAVCNKAGLPEDAWRSQNSRVFKFQAQIFSEQEPGGKVCENKQ